MTKARLCSSSVLALSVSLGLAAAGGAQEDEHDDRIVVTARRREESLQDTPVAVTVLAPSVVAVGVARFHGFEYVALKLSEESLHLVLWEYPVYMLLGLVSAGVALLYMVSA